MSGNRVCYAVKNKDEDIRAKSRSGGVFSALSDLVLHSDGVIYGCVLSDDFKSAHHIRATTEEDRNRMRGSKYIQSQIHDCFKQCANDLIAGKTVLFSGTPCQIDGLNNYLKLKKIITSNLLTVDIICHSVPSPKVWEKFLDWKSENKTVESVDFRDKAHFGWADHRETIIVDGKSISSNEFSTLFYRDITFRTSCHYCYYKSIDRVSDITLGDYWGIDQLDKKFNDDKGVSLILVNSDKGKAFFEKCLNCFEIRKFYVTDCLPPPLEYNYKLPKTRKKFFKDLDKMNFGDLYKKYKYKTEKKYVIIAELISKLKR